MRPEKLLPAAENSERELLASCIVIPSRVWNLESETDAGCFTGLSRPQLREMLRDLVRQHGHASYSMLETEWARRELPTEGLSEIGMLRRCSGIQDWTYHADRVRSTALRRDVIRRSEALTTAANNGCPDEDLIADLRALAATGASQADR